MKTYREAIRIVVLTIAVALACVALATDYTVDFKPSTNSGIGYHQIWFSTNSVATNATWFPIKRLTNSPNVTLTNGYTGQTYPGWSTVITNQPVWSFVAVSVIATNGVETAKDIDEPVFRPTLLRINEQ